MGISSNTPLPKPSVENENTNPQPSLSTSSNALPINQAEIFASIDKNFNATTQNLSDKEVKILTEGQNVTNVAQQILHSPQIDTRPPPPAALTQPKEILNATLSSQLQQNPTHLLNESSLQSMVLEGTPPPPSTGPAPLIPGSALNALNSDPIVDAEAMRRILQKPSERLKEEIKGAVQVDQTKLLNQATLDNMVKERSPPPPASPSEKPMDLAAALNASTGVDATTLNKILPTPKLPPPPPAALEPDTRPPPPAALH